MYTFSSQTSVPKSLFLYNISLVKVPVAQGKTLY